MIDLVTPENRHLYSSELEQMWRQRYEVFVQKLGWDIQSDNQREIDQFDGEKANYLLAIDDSRNVVGATRIIQTTEPHLLSDVFAELCENEVPRGKSIWELSRAYWLPKQGGYDARIRIANELMCGAAEFALLFDVTQFTIEIDIDDLPRFLSLGWDTSPLGYPKEIGGTTMVASIVNITPTTLSNMRTALNVKVPVMRYLQPASAA